MNKKDEDDNLYYPCGYLHVREHQKKKEEKIVHACSLNCLNPFLLDF